mgnify:CR=1 FL=1
MLIFRQKLLHNRYCHTVKLSRLDIKFQICGGTMHFYESDGVQIAFYYGNMGCPVFMTKRRVKTLFSTTYLNNARL